MKRLEIGSYVYLTPPESKNGGEIVLLARQSARICEIVHANGLKDSCNRRDLNRMRGDGKFTKRSGSEDIFQPQSAEISHIHHISQATGAEASEPEAKSWLNNNATVVIKSASKKLLEE